MSAEPPMASSTVAPTSRGLLDIFRPAPAAAKILTDPAEIAGKYRVWQTRVLIFSIVGYATFYFVRKNLGVAMPLMGRELGITKTDLGLFLTLHGARRFSSVRGP